VSQGFILAIVAMSTKLWTVFEGTVEAANTDYKVWIGLGSYEFETTNKVSMPLAPLSRSYYPCFEAYYDFVFACRMTGSLPPLKKP